MPHSLIPFLSQSLVNNDPDGLSIAEILRILPAGWRSKFERFIIETCGLLNTPMSGVDIRNGVLYLTPSEHGKHHELAILITRALSQESARVCMVCGQYGMRRKEQEHKPCLCRTHYLDFINYVEE